MKVIEMVIKEGENPISAISLVENPAIESDFVFLSTDYKVELKTTDEDKRLVIGAALIPDKKIYRDFNGEDVEIFFSKDTVREASQLYLKTFRQSNTTLEHQVPINNITVVESWIVENTDKDKSAVYGLEVPEGTWMVAMKIDNDEIWTDFVKTGNVKGFSIEGQFVDALLSQEKESDEEKIKKLLKKLR